MRDGRVKFTPERWGRVYIDWMEKLRPWCISRQLWWGHQLPVWYCEDGHVNVAETEPQACAECGSAALTRETDVLDTWFSSALWPFATWGWPDETADLAYFYPTNVLSTAREIIFLWVARMVMMGLEFMDDIPFHDVYIHSVIQAADGRRMSKSLGTGIDPLEMIDKYGADATRFALLLMSSSQDVRFSEEKIVMGRGFANKLWNASRLVLLASEGLAAERSDAHQVDRWITSRFQRCLAEVEAAVTVFDFAAAVDTLYHFVWDEFCDWYLELVKVRLYGEDEAQKAQAGGHARWLLGADRAPAASLPAVRHRGGRGAVRRGAAARARASAARRGAAGAGRRGGRSASCRPWSTRCAASAPRPRCRRARCSRPCSWPRAAARPGATRRTPPRSAPWRAPRCASTASPTPSATVVLVPGGRLEVAAVVDKAEEIARLEQQLGKIEAEISRGEAKLANEGFTGRAPEAVVAKERDKLAAHVADRDELAARLAHLRGA